MLIGGEGGLEGDGLDEFLELVAVGEKDEGLLLRLQSSVHKFKEL